MVIIIGLLLQAIKGCRGEKHNNGYDSTKDGEFAHWFNEAVKVLTASTPFKHFRSLFSGMLHFISLSCFF